VLRRSNVVCRQPTPVREACHSLRLFPLLISHSPSPYMINPMDMTGKHVVVTGAGSGIGQATAILLAQLGASLVLVGRDISKLNQTAERLCTHSFVVESFDFTDSDSIPEWLRSVASRTGRIDGLAHCAGIQTFNPLRTLTTKALHRLLAVNTISAAMLLKGMQYMDCGSDRASVVLVASVAAVKADPANGAYGASKAALLSFVRTFSMELVPRNIRLNAVVPALVNTEMVSNARALLTPDAFDALEKSHPMGIGRPEDVAASIAFLLCDAAAWITGTSLTVDGGVSA
jgi:NAD(P)-dependent dehydrogenase (short-subunit alcohol dehydrogenase family)